MLRRKNLEKVKKIDFDFKKAYEDVSRNKKLIDVYFVKRQKEQEKARKIVTACSTVFMVVGIGAISAIICNRIKTKTPENVEILGVMLVD